jgi:hypothetical protein
MNAPLRTLKKDPDANLDYAIDWSEWLSSADVVVTSTFAISPAGLTAGITHNDGLKTSIWLSGGSAGVTYTVTNHVVTEDGRTDDRSFEIVVVER